MSTPLALALAPALGAPATGVIVTGGAAGIGFAPAQALAAVGGNISSQRC